VSGPYTYSAQQGSGGLNDVHFRVQDVQDNRIATCYLEENARLIVGLMNANRHELLRQYEDTVRRTRKRLELALTDDKAWSVGIEDCLSILGERTP